jgi:putative DNA primase/helicase
MSDDKPEAPPSGGPAEVRRLVLAGKPVSASEPEPSAAVTDVAHRNRRRRRNGPRFRVVADGVEKRVDREDKETGETKSEWRWICSPLLVIALTRDPAGEEWGRLLEIRDLDGASKRWAMPMSLLAGDAAQLREKLLGLGLVIAPSSFARAALTEYLASAAPENRVRTVNRIGWHDIGDRTVYVLPDSVFGNVADESVILPQSAMLNDQAYRIGGSPDQWRDQVAKFAEGNSRLVFAVSAAVAAPLLYILGVESGGFHIVGTPSIGKTTLLIVAGSVWGGGGVRGFIKQWRATDNGLEALAAAHCDTLLALDEIAQMVPEAAAAAAYMLANNGAKHRAGRGGEGRVAAEWRTLFLSTGEIDLGAKITETGKGRRATAGQQVRVVDIPGDAGANRGVFEDLHGFDDAGALSAHLRAAANQNYGHAGRELLARIAAEPRAIADELGRYQKQFIAENCPASADGQVHRVANRFAVVAAAGELATTLGILPWAEGEATPGVARCFADWLKQRGGVGSLEGIEAIAVVRRFIEQHGSARFERVGDANEAGVVMPGERTLQRVGFRRTDTEGDITYYILPESWKSEVCAGLGPGFVARVLADRGLLRTGPGDKLTRSERLPGSKGTTRCYVVLSRILGALDDER